MVSVDLEPAATDEQRAAIDIVTGVIEQHCPLTEIRRWLDEPMPYPAQLWRALGEVGCFGLLVDEKDGGGAVSHNGVVDAALLAAERGARLQPGPFVATLIAANLLAGAPVPRHPDAVDDILAGRAAVTWAPTGTFDDRAGEIAMVHRDGRLVASGVIRAVQDAHHSTWVLAGVDHAGERKPVLVELRADGVSLERTPGLDLTRTFWDVHLDGVAVDGAVVGVTDESWESQLVTLAAVLSAAESVGAMDANLRLAVDYAKARHAFGRPIGSFQGLKHGIADTSLHVEMSKAIVASAAVAVGSGDADGAARAAIARSFVSDHAVAVAQYCFQVFGGIGYTWEHDQHLFLRRLAAEAPLFGTPAWHRQRLWEDIDR